ncbi:PaaI family thioesterase [Roseomonas terrae]|uniref:PaaI family thioesterase n=1 Tax=Neoroseomonas terrae TaxID=424799 RepID=A0ABS5EKF7_9PROT|nr:PaaI family thioesterase [Neoroseomonas terrae]MBR0651455.1 PaaI family thioesterase [Neoroseomonas terrae]
MADGQVADDLMEQAVLDIPAGFLPRRAGGPFLEPIGPIYLRAGDGGSTFGIRIERRHCNNGGAAHGGMLATFADLVLGIGGLERAEVVGNFLTVSLVTDYLAPAPLGTWLECRPVLLRRTARLMFVEGRFEADGAPVLRSSGVFSVKPKVQPPR